MDFENYVETPTLEVNKEAEISAPDEKVKEKVEKKNRNKKPTKSTKECKVLAFIKAQHFMIISFEYLECIFFETISCGFMILICSFFKFSQDKS